MSSSDFARINEAINLLIDIKNIFRQSKPTFTMDPKHYQNIKKYLTDLNKILEKLNEKFDIVLSPKLNYMADLKELIKYRFFIITSPKNRKKLIDLGFESAQILATGGPITIDDIKTLNPQISESGLKNFQNKIQKFWKILQSKIEKGNFTKLTIIIEENNQADQILLDRKNEFEKKFSIPIHSIKISSFSQLDNKFLSYLSNRNMKILK